MKKTILVGANLVIGLLFIFLSSHMAATQETEISITGIRSSKGNIIVQVFKDDAGYQDEKPLKKFTFDKKSLAAGTLTVSVGVEPGVYGFTMIDDENTNGKIDKTFIGIPKEGFGFSNFFMEKMKKPKFDEFKVDSKTARKIVMKVKYM